MKRSLRLMARYLKWTPDMEEYTPKTKGVYKVRSLRESCSGKKYIHVWGWNSETELNEDWELLENGNHVTWD